MHENLDLANSSRFTLHSSHPHPTKSPKDLSQFALPCTPPISVGQEEKSSDTAGLQVRLSLPQTPASLSQLTSHPQFSSILLLHPPSLVNGSGFRTQLCDPVVVAQTRTLVHTEPFMTTDLPTVDSPITFQELESDVSTVLSTLTFVQKKKKTSTEASPTHQQNNWPLWCCDGHLIFLLIACHTVVLSVLLGVWDPVTVGCCGTDPSGSCQNMRIRTWRIL